MTALRLLLACLLVLAGSAAAAAPGLRFGVQTHFDQGWPIELLGQVRRNGASGIRDDIVWGKVETRPGHYDFTPQNADYVRTACHRGLDVLVIVDPRNGNYDGGQTVHTPAAQAAYARFLLAVLDRFGTDCVSGIEIGNEINGGGGAALPAGMDLPRVYAALLAVAYPMVKARFPAVTIVGACTNAIGTGFIERIFAAGGLAHMDAVAVHPYRTFPEGVDVELGRLQLAMRRHGGAKPIWVTEFGGQFADPARAAPHLVKMAALMSAGGVQRAYWYALVDEPWWPNNGLIDPQQRTKPAAEAARLAAATLFEHGRARRIDARDARTMIYRFDGGDMLMWGSPRAITFTGAPRFRDAQGHPVPPPTQLSDEPLIVSGSFRYRLGADPVVADTRYEFARAPWSYVARRRDGQAVRLALTDWEWTSRYTAPGVNPLEIAAATLVAAGDGRDPLAATLRYTAPAARSVIVSACFTKGRGGDGMDLGIYRNGRSLFDAVLVDRLMVANLTVDLARGDTLDIALGPNVAAGNDAASFRVRLVRPRSGLQPACD